MPDDFDSPGSFLNQNPDSPFIRISRNGSVTDVASHEEPIRTRSARVGSRSIVLDPESDFDSEVEEPIAPKRPSRGTRPMPKRLSEEAREQAEREQMESAIEEPAPTPVKQKRTRASKKKEAEQMALPLKPQRVKPDSLVKQRQVLGFSCVMIAVLVLLAIVSYTPDDAPFAETHLSDIPAIFTGSNPIVNAHADQVHNWLRLLGAMLADFLINKTIGYAAIIYPIFFGAWSLAFFRFTYKQRRRLTLATTFFLITAILFSATIGTASNFTHIPREWSGAVGQFLGLAFTRLIGAVGAFIVYASAFVITLVFSIDLDIERTFLRLKGYWMSSVLFVRRQWIEFWDRRETTKLQREKEREAEDAERALEEAAELAEQEQPDIAIAREDTETIEPKKRKREAPIEDERTSRANDRAKSAETSTGDENGRAEDPSEREPIKILRTLAPAAAGGMLAAAAPAAAQEAASPIGQGTAQIVAKAAPQVMPGQPLLKVRPAPKAAAGGAIPRMTRPEQTKLGERSMSFSRLTNGAVQPDDEAPSVSPVERLQNEHKIVAASDVAQKAAPIDVQPEPEAISASDIKSEAQNGLANIDLRDAIISPIAPKVKPEQKITVRSERSSIKVPEVIVGDEKALSNDALPHSADNEDFRDVVREHQSASKNAAKEAAAGRASANGLFYEEGEKPFVPENPYQEILIKYRNPSISLLTPADPKDQPDADDEELAKKGRLLRDKLATFGVEIENITVTPGPVVTLYEFTPAEGVKVSRVENLTDDIALAMKARGIRIIAPIPGKGTIGVEIPNDSPKIVRISSLFQSESFRNTKMNLPLALGKTISGDVYVDDLNKMPHLLIAGATGSGKSVGVNAILASLLYAKSPRDVKFVIVDPKKIELSLYKKLRKHYLIVSPEAGEDIVTTPAYAVLALKAVELEMEKRYDKLAKAAVRSLADYNIKVAQGKLRSTQEEQHYHLPYIVVIIDELADLMITAAREIEEPICRIAQMARAVGIHLILATQRPSVDVITGVIKANFPARIAYQVATRVDSRTILDCMGAEQLLGNGDMLYQPSGTPKPIRLQSPYISTEEVEAMIDAIAVQDGDKLSYSRPWTLPSLKSKDGRGGPAITEEDGRDELFEEAARIIVRHQQGSVSLLQRRLKVGYSRAARIVDELEQAAIVGAFDGSKARQVLCENEEELELVLEGLR